MTIKQLLHNRTLRNICMSVLMLSVTMEASAEDQVLRIGTGGGAGTYYLVGSLIAEGLNKHIQQDHSENTALANHIVLPQRSNGSVSNIQEIKNGLLESALVQADVMHWAANGTGPYESSAPVDNVRAIASLYVESMHLVASTTSGISSIHDLAGARVSVDEIGSGTQIDAAAVLQHFGLSETKAKIVYLKPIDAIDRMRNGQLDAFFMVSGYPIVGVENLVREGSATIVPIQADQMSEFLDMYPFLTMDEIPAQIYGNVEAVTTVGVAAQWVVEAGVDSNLVYEITKTLWSKPNLDLLAKGHPKGRDVDLDSALLGLSVPLHPGAQRYYSEMGMEIPSQ